MILRQVFKGQHCDILEQNRPIQLLLHEFGFMSVKFDILPMLAINDHYFSKFLAAHYSCNVHNIIRNDSSLKKHHTQIFKKHFPHRNVILLWVFKGQHCDITAGFKGQ